MSYCRIPTLEMQFNHLCVHIKTLLWILTGKKSIYFLPLCSAHTNVLENKSCSTFSPAGGSLALPFYLHNANDNISNLNPIKYVCLILPTIFQTGCSPLLFDGQHACSFN